MKKTALALIILLIVILCIFVWVWRNYFALSTTHIEEAKTTAQQLQGNTTSTALLEQSVTVTELTYVPLSERAPDDSAFIKQDVPFTAQAPDGNWDDPRQQDGCEEASVLMAVLWARNQSITPGTALQEILALSQESKEQTGYFKDTNIEDTARFMESYYAFTSYEIITSIDTTDIEQAIRARGVVLVQVDGRLLGNPYFTAPGPEHHMLAVIGYDQSSDEFITNDPGTRNGAGFRYTRAVLGDALADYPTGNHNARKKTPPSMIVVYPE